MRFYCLSVVVISSLPLYAIDRSENLKAKRSHEFIYDWSALGSGCHGQLDERDGNVTLDATPPIPPFLNRHRLRFMVKNLKLESPVPKDQGQTNLEFARDCAIRVALNPLPGKKIVSIEADSAFNLSKPMQTDMKTMAQLTLGMDTLGTTIVNYDQAEAFTNVKKAFHIDTDALETRKLLSEIKCGQAKIMGLDLLLYVKRPQDSVAVEMSLDKNRVDLIVDLEACQ